jgi:hypothetical protein
MHKVDTNIPKKFLFDVNSNNSPLDEHLLMIGAMQCVDKGCPIRINNSLFNGRFNLNNLLAIKKLVANCVLVGF